MQTGLYKLADKTVYYGSDGAMQYGEQLINGLPYYFQPGNGAMLLGWRDYNGATYYYTTDGIVLGEKKIDGHWYYFDETDGQMRTGLVIHHGNTYYYVSRK